MIWLQALIHKGFLFPTCSEPKLEMIPSPLSFGFIPQYEKMVLQYSIKTCSLFSSLSELTPSRLQKWQLQEKGNGLMLMKTNFKYDFHLRTKHLLKTTSTKQMYQIVLLLESKEFQIHRQSHEHDYSCLEFGHRDLL